MQRMTVSAAAATQNNDELAQLEDQLASLGRILDKEYTGEREVVEAKHERELRALLRAQAKELKEFNQAAQEKKEAKLKEAKANIQRDNGNCRAKQHYKNGEQGDCTKIGTCPKCDEASSTTNLQGKVCGCYRSADNLPSLCDGCIDNMKLKGTICGSWTCNDCHNKHVEDCRLCEADEDGGWLVGY